jgi:hypothetical protein
MRTWIVTSALTLGAVIGACASGQPTSPGELAADFGGTWVNHPDTTLSAQKGKVVFVEVWRTW